MFAAQFNWSLHLQANKLMPVETVTSADGTSIAFERAGTGPPLVLVHGTTADRSHWDLVRPLLEPGFSVCAVDRRGRGDSGDGAAYSLEREYEDIAAVVDSLPGPVDLLGHSYGGLVCLEATLRTNNLGKLLLYEPTFGRSLYPAGLRQRLEESIGRGDLGATVATFWMEAMGASPAQVEEMRAAPDWAKRLAIAPTLARELADGDYDFTPSRFEELQAPTFLLMGTESPAEFRASTIEVHKAMFGSQLIEIPGQGHGAARRAPGLFAALVLEFLSR